MANSFNRTSSFICRSLLAVCVMSTLAACDRPDTQRKSADSSQASFLVDKASGYGELVNADPKSTWRVANSALFSFTACLKDKATNETLRGHKFVAQREDGVKFTPEEASDIGGCIKWSEEIAFNSFAAKSSRLPITRQIIGEGIYAGKREVRFAINPWAVGAHSRDRGQEVVFLRDQILPKGQLADPSNVQLALSGDMRGAANLWLPTVEINTIRRESSTDGSAIDIEFAVKPKIQMTDMNGETIYREINSGAFDIIAHLIVADTGGDQKKKILLTTTGIQGSGQVKDGYLIVNARTSIERRVSYGNLQLALKLIPKGLGSLTSLRPYEGIYELGGSNDLSKGPRGRLTEYCRKESPDCSVEKILASTSNFEEMKRQGYAHGNDPYIFSNLKLRFATVQPGETATQRHVVYTASTCITDRWSGKSMDDLPFKIEYLNEDGSVINEKTLQVSTNEEGCLNWDSTIFHKYYQPERLFWNQVRISFGDGKASRILKFALNPWDDKFTFGWDAREFSANFIATVQKKKKIPSRFFLSSYGYHTVRFLYNIDRFMELEVKKTVLVELNPVVLRYSGIVNARKQTEDLRDGIYLLKVGIQKDYLDPADRSHKIENKLEAIPPAKLEELGGGVSRKEYVTTQTQLVRVVDGRINHPVELTMRDLRLMRIRANFMIQLETIDERLVTAHHVLRDQFRNELDALKKQREQFSELPKNEREEKLKEAALARKEKLETAFFVLKDRLDQHGTSMDKLDLTLDKDVMDPLKAALDTNDFTEVKFAQAADFDLNNFIEKDSGLEKRTFVGPVIFLSNAFGDAMRATDNLDEARCDEPDAPDLTDVGLASLDATDTVKKTNEFKWDELRLFANSEKDNSSSRQNNAYRFSKYYGSLKHLCNKSVDNLIEREKVNTAFFEKNMPILASIYNFVALYNLEFLSLGGEKLQKLDLNCPVDSGNCLQPTDERTIPTQTAVTYVNNAFDAKKQVGIAKFYIPGEQDKFKPFTVDEVSGLLLGDMKDTYTRYGACSLLAGRAADHLSKIAKDERYSTLFAKWMSGNRPIVTMTNTLFTRCIMEYTRNKNPIFTEDRLRVRETGRYTFAGGMQMNLNVGESTSISRSESWGYGFDPLDVIGGPAIASGALIGAMVGGPVGAGVGAGVGMVAGQAAKTLKPLSLKYGKGLGNSDGTSVSLSTYLVGQIARFNIQLNEYETCRVMRFDPQFALDMVDDLSLHEKLAPVLARGVFVCSGYTSKKPVNVDERYYYFTQHFTEGDMLDQADIYNHPWLLALRGVREFGALVSTTNAQEAVNYKNFGTGVFKPESRALGWPLEHMAITYRKMLPTFPGLYTVVGNLAQGTNYPFAEREGPTDLDINGEVRCKLTADKVCAPKATPTQPVTK